MKTKTRRVVGFCLVMVVAWTLTAWLASRLVVPRPDRFADLGDLPFAPPTGIRAELSRALVAGVFSGLLASVLELRVLPHKARRLGMGAMLLARTVVYSIVGVLSVFATVRFMARRELGIPVREVLSSDGFQAFLRSPNFGTMIVVFVAASFIINGIIQVSRLLGPRTLTQILLGRYVRPQHEERSFLFIDLSDSTSIAERLGPLDFADFKNEFFHDVAEPVLNTRGQIVQYVGDEVLITWPAHRRGGRLASVDSVRCFFDLQARIDQRAEDYRSRFGVVPRFRAGLHTGPVVVSELGDIKREIVFSGDAVNTASRIQGLCRELAHDFLASEEALAGSQLPDGIHRDDLGDRSLRGRDTPIGLVALRVQA